MRTASLNEETRGLLRRVVEGQAYRQLMVANIRGHALKFASELEDKILLARDLNRSLEIFRDLEKLYGELDRKGLTRQVRGKMERIPYPSSRLELAICLSLSERAERTAAEGYRDCISDEFAHISRSLLELHRDSTQHGEELLVQFCQELGNRPHAQQMFNRWLAICLLSMGRPGTPADRRAVELGLRSRLVGDSVKSLLDGLAEFMQACGLVMPDGRTLGVELPTGLAAAATHAANPGGRA